MTSCILPHQSVTYQSKLIINDLYLTSSISTQTRADSSSMTSCILPHQSVHQPEQTHHQWPVSYLINQYTDQSRLIINDLLYLTSSISTQTRGDSSSVTSCILPHQSVHRPEQTHHQWPPVSYLINQYTDQSRPIINDLLYLSSSISTQTRADSSSMTSCILPHQSVHRQEQAHHQWPPVSYLINQYRPEQNHHQWAPVSYLINQYTDQSRIIINDLLYLTSSISSTYQSKLIINDLYLTSSISTQTRAGSSSMTCILPHQSVHRQEQTHHQWPPVSYLINQYRPEQTHHQWPVSYLINQYTDQSRLIINDLYLTSSISTQTRADSSSMTSCILPHQSVHRPEQTHHQLPHQSVHRPEQTHHQWPPVSYLINQ